MVVLIKIIVMVQYQHKIDLHYEPTMLGKKKYNYYRC